VSGCPKAIGLILQLHGESKGHGFLGWIVLGLVAGALAKLIMPGDDPGGIIVTMLLGIVGAVVGGFLGSRFFGRGLETFWNLQTWIVAIIGSLILLGIYRLVIGRSRAVTR
jgi:uncharacterized membrane protein YeaQ/YmgE (transglycosylase-associated protein family)